MMTLTYIWHDCFVLASDKLTMVFDFWKDPMQAKGSLPDFILSADKTKPLYVIVSHHHKDHYTKSIFEWSSLFREVHYILSEDVAKSARHILNADSIYAGPRPPKGSVSILSCGMKYEDGLVSIKAFGSTDIGNSYMVEVEDRHIFHAGDLNAWLWVDESTDEEVRDALNSFTNIVDEISAAYPRIDLAMFPVDSRIGTDYFRGAYVFVRKIDVGRFFPMHFGLGNTPEEQLKYRRDAARLTDYANPERGEYICLQASYSSWCGRL